MIQKREPARLSDAKIQRLQERLMLLDDIAANMSPSDLRGHLRMRFQQAGDRLHRTMFTQLDLAPKAVAILCREEAVNLLWIAEQLTSHTRDKDSAAQTERSVDETADGPQCGDHKEGKNDP